MAWIAHPPRLYTIVKPDRPLIDIPQTHHDHRDPLRTPEDIPLQEPWISTQSDDIYHVMPFDVEHHSFPDVEDTNWAMGMVSPPSPSRRHSLDLLPDVCAPRYADETEGLDWEAGTTSSHSPSRRNSLDLPPDLETDVVPDIDDTPMLSPPSPCMRPLAELHDAECHWPPPHPDCPQLSPPSPVHCGSVLLSLEFDSHSLFVEDVQPPYVEPPELSSPRSPLLAEYHGLLSLRERTVYAERTSRARNKVFRGRERELGRAVAELRATEASSSNIALEDTKSTLHAFRAAATRVMIERTEEKRCRKKAKECLKELRVLLGTGVDALLSTEAVSPDATMGTGLVAAPEHFHDTGGLGLALHEPPSAEEMTRGLADRKYVMQRLTACMTMRRRDLRMRSLLEAGNLADGTNGAPAVSPCQRSRLGCGVPFTGLGDPGGERSEKGSEASGL